MIFLHVGHSKTGSSAIQSFLVLNRDLLAEYGVDYPAHPSDEKAAAGRISSGNVRVKGDWHNTALEKIDQSNCEHVLFSNETLFGRLNAASLKAIASRHETTVIVYLRDPVDHMYSAYGQMIKRGGETGDVDAYARRYQLPMAVLRLFRMVEGQNVRLEARNYSHHKKDIIANFVEIILPEGHRDFLERAEIHEQPINRSLTLAEYELQKCFNQAYGKGSSRFISDPLVESLPGVAAERHRVSNATLAIMEERLSREVGEINKRVPDSEHITLRTEPNETDTGPSETYSFSREQLTALAKSITRELRKPRATDAQPAPGPAHDEPAG